MSVTISLPDIQLPDGYPLLRATNKPWDKEELATLAERLAPGARLEDVGLWQVAVSDRQRLEVYLASRSFRVEDLGSNEFDGGGEEGVDAAKAESIAREALAPWQIDGAEFLVSGVSESIFMVSGRPLDGPPPRFVSSTDVSFAVQWERAAFVGPGAKAQVRVRPDGSVCGLYRMWRDLEQVGEVPGRSLAEIAHAFGSSPTFAHLNDRTAKVVVDSALVGLFALPPTEFQDVFHPAVELRGSVTTQEATVGFCTYVAAVDPRRMIRARHEFRPTAAPAELVA